MKFNLNTMYYLIATLMLVLLGFSGATQAVNVTGTCPSEHNMSMGAMTLSSDVKKALANRADKDCSNCHGSDGNGINPKDNVPNLAGQDFMYLCAWLSECHKKGKQCDSHEDVAAQLSDHDIVGLAMFYTHLPSNKW